MKSYTLGVVRTTPYLNKICSKESKLQSHIMFQSYEYFQYDVAAIPGKPGYFLVSPAWGYPTQWGESHEDQWEQSARDCLNFLDITEAELLAL